ncbi:hypothetical protein [Pseudobacteriovorax antillogorgiicola]|uniref:Tat (Twin-arginine translocation) pathway signal sequence n=1 Tax=Pseudobacteriovorax antillogorgiicola TaxID=1513793 RepID=A0A1Y6BS88_9BACT|nr:hypothetical protein [Pseudobacteriovorax antillogorgiicola]TCS54564.1 hypothetical protein EDD56_10677 [Pseudobacteriovorax antillogorgiicola]SMF18231.1 hypothetical protein SAMN06296036_106166 [Pseudobacteriovorax antillogorgiicola]
MTKPMNRRQLLTRLSLLGLSPSLALQGCMKNQKIDLRGATGTSLGLGAGAAGQKPRFLFVFGAMGGASINDSFLAVRQSESDFANELNTFPDQWVKSIEGTHLRAVDLSMNDIGPLPFPVRSNQSLFVQKHFRDIMVSTMEHSTVSHPLGQKRILTGNDAWNGRTLQEIVALQYGQGMALPNVNMSSLGFAEPGSDRSLPKDAVAELVSNPNFFTLGLHGHKGVPGVPEGKLVDIARRFRRDLDQQSDFYKTFKGSDKIQEWLRLRQDKQKKIEALNLIDQLNLFEETSDLPFSDFGLNPNVNGDAIRELFPDLGADPLQTQAALAYMLVSQGISSAVTMGLGMNVTINGNDLDNPLLTNTPTGFDYSHNAHRGTQALLWNRSLDIIDRLITLLKRTEFGNEGESLWDRSLILIATEFGRDKSRPKDAEEFSSGHHQNNGITVISPMVNGGQVLGGVDPNTLLTYGFDPATGKANPNRQMTEKEIFAGILQALGVDTSEANLPDMKAMRKGLV